jgi:hypothetical protein
MGFQGHGLAKLTQYTRNVDFAEKFHKEDTHTVWATKLKRGEKDIAWRK